MHEQGLSGLQSCAVDNICPNGEMRFGQSCRVDERYTGRHWQGAAFMRKAILGITAARDQYTDLITDAIAFHARTYGNNRGSLLTPRNLAIID